MTNVSLTALAREQLELATNAHSGRSAHTVIGGHEHSLRQTVIALTAGSSLSEHSNPGEATVHVLLGRVRLDADGDSWEGASGHLIDVPHASHSLLAIEDAVILLTVMNRG
ncbi:MAG: cupin domain-containing protein [Ornithinibacter sp.]